VEDPDPPEETGQPASIAHVESLSLIATESQLAIPVRSTSVDLDQLPPQLRVVLKALDGAVKTREPAIRARVDELRARYPDRSSPELARELIRSTRRRVAATGALSGAASIAPGLGTVLAIGTITSQTLFALEQEIELVLGIAMIYGHVLGGSDDRVLEALVVVGITSGAVKLREDVIVIGGERLAVAAFRSLPTLLLRHGGGRFVGRILARVATTGAAKVAARVVPLGVGIGVGAGFDWLAVTGLGRAAMRYYGPGGPRARPLLVAPEDSTHVELGH
jgi:hypothetical protein